MSGAALDMSLDDLIKKNKKSDGAGNSRGRGRSSGPGPARRIPNRNANRAAPYAPAKAPESSWQHDMFGGDGYSGPSASRSGSIETGTKLYLSNLEYSVSNEDIKELFAEVGDLKRCAVHYDKSGRSKGTAEVVFSRRQDGMAAVKRYNNVQLDGKPMKIEIVGTNIVTPAPVAQSSNGAFLGDANRAPRSGQGRGGYGGRSRGGGGGGRGRGFRRGGGGGGGGGRGRGRGEKVSVSAEDLDADLESYHAEAMQTN